jgi:hypothetical protein
MEKKMAVNVTRFNRGSGGVYIILGDNFDEVSEKATELKNELDPWSSPCVDFITRTAPYRAEVKYYTLD